jgi:hypothetical protein
MLLQIFSCWGFSVDILRSNTAGLKQNFKRLGIEIGPQLIQCQAGMFVFKIIISMTI